MSPEPSGTTRDAAASTLVPVFGHAELLSGLERAAREGRPPQALLMVGPRGVGKRTVGLRVAQALLCMAEAASWPCGACRACRLTADGAHPDLHRVESPLRIEAARELQSALALAPAEGPWRVALLPEIESASIGAANSLLKLLEEPPRHAVLLLSAVAAEEVLPTIRSRARRVRLRALAPPVATQALEQGWGIDSAQASRLARWSGGCLGRALEIAADDDAVAARDAWLSSLERILGAGPAERLALAAALARDRDVLPSGLALWNGWWRDALHLCLGVDGAMVHQERRDALEAAAGALDARRGVAAVRAVERALEALAAHANPQLTLEVLLLDLPRIPLPASRAA